MACEELEKLSTNLKQMHEKFSNDQGDNILKQIENLGIKHRESLSSGKGSLYLS